MSSKHISPTHATNEYIANNENDYLDRNQSALGKSYNMLQMQSNSTPSVQTIVPNAPPSSLPMTFGKPMAGQQRANNIDIDDQSNGEADGITEFTEQMENESERIAHEAGISIEQIDNNHLRTGDNNDGASEDDGQTINSARRSQADTKSQFKIINQGSIKIKYQSSQASEIDQLRQSRASKADSFNERM